MSLLAKLLDIMASFAEEYKYERVEERYVDETTGQATVEVGEDWGEQDPRMNFTPSPAREGRQPARQSVHFHAAGGQSMSGDGEVTMMETVVMDEFPAGTFREVPLSDVAFPRSGAAASPAQYASAVVNNTTVRQ